jgi:hypothetical protein
MAKATVDTVAWECALSTCDAFGGESGRWCYRADRPSSCCVGHETEHRTDDAGHADAPTIKGDGALTFSVARFGR